MVIGKKIDLFLYFIKIIISCKSISKILTAEAVLVLCSAFTLLLHILFCFWEVRKYPQQSRFYRIRLVAASERIEKLKINAACDVLFVFLSDCLLLLMDAVKLTMAKTTTPHTPIIKANFRWPHSMCTSKRLTSFFTNKKIFIIYRNSCM